MIMPPKPNIMDIPLAISIVALVVAIAALLLA